jgi:hypothetical protein
MARTGPSVPVWRCPLFGEYRKSRFEAARSESDPERTWVQSKQGNVCVRFDAAPKLLLRLLRICYMASKSPLARCIAGERRLPFTAHLVVYDAGARDG